MERANGQPIEESTANYDLINRGLERRMSKGIPVYSAAYIMPSPKFGNKRKYKNHLALINQMIEDNLPERIRQRPALSDVYELLLSYSGIGPFLAFQFTIDLNYSSLLDFEEDDFVVAGPGAIDGISKCFENYRCFNPAEIIYHVTANQDKYLEEYGVNFQTLFGRKLKPIDCQNLFCEISKYARVAHPDVEGISGRKRIKQGFVQSGNHLPVPYFPDKWGINKNVEEFLIEFPQISGSKLI